MPLLEAFGRMLTLTLSLAGQALDDYVLSKKPGGKQPGAHATRAYLKKLVDIQALLGHESIATTQIYTIR